MRLIVFSSPLSLCSFLSRYVQKACKKRAEKKDEKLKNMAKISLYLDTRGKKKEAPSPLKLVIRHQKEAAMINLEIMLTESTWDHKAQRVKNNPNWRKLNDIISSLLLKATNIIFDLKYTGVIGTMSAAAIRDKIKAELWGTTDKIEKKSFVDLLNIRIGLSRSASSKNQYKCVLRSLQLYDKKIDCYSCDQITPDFLRKYILHAEQEQHFKPNSIVLYITLIKSVLNYAYEEGYIDRQDYKRVKVKQQETRKRYLTAQQLRELWFHKSDSDRINTLLDLFKASFLLIGINFADIYDLEPPQNGMVEYYRAKTGRLYHIAVQPELQPIIDKYGTATKCFDFIPQCTRATIGHYINHYLKQLPFDFAPQLTLYWARHTWATIASEIGISKDVIAAALGHGAKTVTDIYISFDRNKIDQANRAVIDYVLYDKKSHPREDGL